MRESTVDEITKGDVMNTIPHLIEMIQWDIETQEMTISKDQDFTKKWIDLEKLTLKILEIAKKQTVQEEQT